MDLVILLSMFVFVMLAVRDRDSVLKQSHDTVNAIIVESRLHTEQLLAQHEKQMTRLCNELLWACNPASRPQKRSRKKQNVVEPTADLEGKPVPIVSQQCSLPWTPRDVVATVKTRDKTVLRLG